MTSRIGGPIPPEPPRSTRGTQGADGGKFQKEMSKVEEVEKVGESEFDKQGKRAFKKPIEEEDELEEIETRAPTPFETEFHLPTPPVGFSELDVGPSKAGEGEDLGAVLSSPTAPSAKPMPPSDEDLPESEQFWEENDLPDQPLEPIQFEEKGSSKKMNQPLAAKQRESLFVEEKKPKELKTPQEKPAKGKEALLPEKQAQKQAGSAPSLQKPFSKTTGEPLANAPREKQGKASPEIPGQMQEARKVPVTPAWGGKEEEKAQLPYPEAMIASEQMQGGKEREKKKGKTETSVPVHPPEPLPPACQKIAEAAQVSASPFLNTQTAELYLQMVGTMVFMTSSKEGISLTEVQLNSPSFQNSVFFNSTITIAKYATAPDSFNVRLTGTPEAVQAFSNNVESLSSAFTAAYEDRRISFRIGRIETALAPNRPLIRRKKEGESKENLM